MRGLREEFQVMTGVIRATDKTKEEAVGLLVIQEAESGFNATIHQEKKQQVFKAQQGHCNKICHYCQKKGHISPSCFKNPESTTYNGQKDDRKDDKLGNNGAHVASFMAQATNVYIPKSTSWVIDSGDTGYMCNTCSAFSTLTKDTPVA